MKPHYQLCPRARRIAREHAGRLVDAVVQRTGMAAADILESTASDRVRLRAAIAWLIRQLDGLSYREIALILGRHDHSTGWYLVRRAEALRASDWSIRLLTDCIMGEVK